MIVYIDIFFLINFIADFFILHIVSPKSSANKLKIILASLFGAAYSCLYFLKTDFNFFSPFIKPAVLFIMTFIAYYPLRLKKLFETFMLSYITSAFMSGMTYSIMSFFNNSENFNMYTTTDFILIFSFSLSFVIYKLSKKIYKNNITNNILEIMVFYMDKKIKINGVVDTCNSLCDPISKKPVIVTDIDVLKKLFNESLFENNLCEFVKPEDFCVIPYKTISDNGILYGFKPEKVTIQNNTVTDVIIAVAPRKLENDALLNPLII